MTEATVVRRIVSYLKQHLPAAVIFKINDRITAGIPDLAVTAAGRTTWLEVKVIRGWNEPVSALRRKFDALQLATMRQLARQGVAYYLVSRGAELDLVTPIWIKRALGYANDVETVGPTVQGYFTKTMAALVQLIHPRR